jgi:hypothetical protein
MLMWLAVSALVFSQSVSLPMTDLPYAFQCRMASGPLIEGWHGQPYGKPLKRARILGRIFGREKPAKFQASTTGCRKRPGSAGLG